MPEYISTDICRDSHTGTIGCPSLGCSYEILFGRITIGAIGFCNRLSGVPCARDANGKAMARVTV